MAPSPAPATAVSTTTSHGGAFSCVRAKRGRGREDEVGQGVDGVCPHRIVGRPTTAALMAPSAARAAALLRCCAGDPRTAARRGRAGQAASRGRHRTPRRRPGRELAKRNEIRATAFVQPRGASANSLQKYPKWATVPPKDVSPKRRKARQTVRAEWRSAAASDIVSAVRDRLVGEQAFLQLMREGLVAGLVAEFLDGFVIALVSQDVYL